MACDAPEIYHIDLNEYENDQPNDRRDKACDYKFLLDARVDRRAAPLPVFRNFGGLVTPGQDGEQRRPVNHQIQNYSGKYAHGHL